MLRPLFRSALIARLTSCFFYLLPFFFSLLAFYLGRERIGEGQMRGMQLDVKMMAPMTMRGETNKRPICRLSERSRMTYTGL